MLDVAGDAHVTVNDSPVSGLIALRDGDRVAFDRCEARLAVMENVALRAESRASNDDLFATTVRQALPRFVLRGVSGKVFGRGFALIGTTTIGRAPESSLCLDESGISRAHARLMPSEDGVQVEDLGSTNGTFVNGKRVLHAVARAGDEIGFDTLRFRLTSTAPGEDAVAPAGPEPGPMDQRLVWGVVVGIALLAAAILVAL
jgi:hypothetical protein